MNSQKTQTGQLSHIQLHILTGSLPSRAAFSCWSLQAIVLQNINQICLPAHSCKVQTDQKIKEDFKEEWIQGFRYLGKEVTPERESTCSRPLHRRQRKAQSVLGFWTARAHPDMQRLRRARCCSPAHLHVYHTFWKHGLQKSLGSSSQTNPFREGAIEAGLGASAGTQEKV